MTDFGKESGLFEIQAIRGIVDEAAKLEERLVLEAQADGADFDLRDAAIMAINHPATAFASQHSLAALSFRIHSGPALARREAKLFGEYQLSLAGNAQPVLLADMVDHYFAHCAEQLAAAEALARGCSFHAGRMAKMGISFVGRLNHDLNDNDS
jgi:hypothetical protein